MTSMRRDRLVGIGFVAASIFNSIWIFPTYLSNTLIGAFEPASFSRIMGGTAERPYAYRTLVPDLSRLVSPVLPADLPDWFNGVSQVLSDTFNRLSGGIYDREAAFVLLTMFLSLAGFASAERALLADLDYDKREQFIFPLAIQIFVLPVSMFTGYYYDLPQLYLVTVSLLLLYRRKWIYYLALFAIANLNKETSVLLIAVFCIHYWPRLPRGEFIRLLGWQTAIAAVIRIYMTLRFHDNAGSPLVFTFPDQVAIYREHPLALLFTLASCAMIAFLAARQWNTQKEFLRSASIMGLILFFLFIPFGYPLEFRVFLDCLPVLGVLILPRISPAR